MRNLLLVAIIIFGVGCIVYFARKPSTHRLELTTSFADAKGLRAGATVRLAGVDIGTVTSVRARPELRDHPAEIKMDLSTNYELSIPGDATVSLSTDGVLGPTYARIDVAGASGPPIQNHGTLKGVTSSDVTQAALDALQRQLNAVMDQLNQTHCAPAKKEPPASPNRVGGQVR